MTTESIEAQREAHDRRQRAWVYLVLGVLVSFFGWGGIKAESSVWNLVGGAVFLGAAASVTYGLILFQKRRP